MIRPKLKYDEVKVAMEMACERCVHYDDCEDQAGWYGEDYQCEFGRLYDRILQEFGGIVND